jgi:hypothetical protein
LLLSTWAEETPDDRLLLLNELATGLSMDDEPFLEETLDDRRGAVRQRAAELLARLPDSGLVRRMTERADGYIDLPPDTRSGLRRLLPGGQPKVEVRLPIACDKAMQRDGVDPKPIGKRGERGWWLLQSLRVVPLGHWVERWGAAPAEIVAAALRSEEADLLVETWTEAAKRQRDLDWARAFLDARPDDRHVRPLIGLLPPAEREARALAALAGDDSLGLDSRASICLSHSDHLWSAGLSRAVIRAIADHVAAANPGGIPLPEVTFRHQLGQYANHVDPALADEAAALPWPTDRLQQRFWADAVDAFLARLRFRRDMLEEITR